MANAHTADYTRNMCTQPAAHEICGHNQLHTKYAYTTSCTRNMRTQPTAHEICGHNQLHTKYAYTTSCTRNMRTQPATHLQSKLIQIVEPQKETKARSSQTEIIGTSKISNFYPQACPFKDTSQTLMAIST